jgi:hypothetical protein
MMWPSYWQKYAWKAAEIWFLYKKYKYTNIGVNKKWVSNWANIGPKWPNVKYDVAFCGLLWQKYARKAAEIWSLYKKCDGGGHFLLCCKTSFFCDMVFIMVLVLVLVFLAGYAHCYFIRLNLKTRTNVYLFQGDRELGVL